MDYTATGAIIGGVNNEFRYTLERKWHEDGGCGVFVMLNPSTADESEDDPTIRRCVHFMRREGCGSLTVVNLFAFRTTYPDELLEADDPVGPNNDQQIVDAVERADVLVVGWGAHGSFNDRDLEVMEILRLHARVPIQCLGVIQSGAPKHPLARGKSAIRNDAPLIEYAGRD